MDSAARHFREALRHDPLYAAAHSGLADVHVLGYGPAGKDGPRLAVHEARAALAIDPQLAEAHASLGMALFYHELDFSAAERAFRRSIELEPSYATAHHWFAELLAAQGRLDESIREVRIAESLDPLSTIIGWNVARILDFARRREESIAKLAAVERLHPDDAQVQASLIGMLLTLGRKDEAGARFDRLILGLPDEIRTANQERLRQFRAGIAAGDPAALLRFLELVVPGQSHQRIFAAHRIAISGHVDSAMRLVQALHEERSFGQMLPDMAVGPLFDPFRDDPRFQSILRELRIDPAIGRRLRDSDPIWRSSQRP
jgi:tetratricopeptide (TPR) repeat protein